MFDHAQRSDLAGSIAIRLGVAFVFTLVGIDKFYADPHWIHVFDAIGFGQWFRYVTGVIEIVGGLLFLIPAVTSVGAFLLVATMLGASAVQLLVFKRPADSLFPLIFLAGVVVAFVKLRSMRRSRATALTGLVLAILGAPAMRLPGQVPGVRTASEDVLREYTGTYQWGPDAFLYLQLWSELAGTNQLVAFDESGELRTLYPTDRDRFFAGPGAAVRTSVESTIEFQRDANGTIASLAWQRAGGARRVAQRVALEKRENVQFSNGDVRLVGTLISPRTGAKHPAIVLVHASGAEDREYLLPLAHFLIRHGIALLGYDKRGVGESSGDWRTASFDDLAGDVVAAVQYLKTRSDVDAAQIGLLGWSQAGWVMPLAAVRSADIAFLISVSGAAVPAAETTIDQARNEMTATGMRTEVVDRIVDLMKLQYRFARTGEGWQEYVRARESIAARMGRPPQSFPGSPDDPYWGFIRRLYFYDPAPTLGRLRVPTLALFGELDNNIVAAKNRGAWESALRAAGNRDYTLRILPSANHLQLEAKVGSNAEMPSLQRFVPAYQTTVRDWLAARIRGFRP